MLQERSLHIAKANVGMVYLNKHKRFYATFEDSQLKKKWLGEKEPVLNQNITIGILGIGFLGSYVGKQLNNIGYNYK